MPLVTDYNQVKEVYAEAAERGVGLPVFCAEDRETLEGILASALEFGREIGVRQIDSCINHRDYNFASGRHIPRLRCIDIHIVGTVHRP